MSHHAQDPTSAHTSGDPEQDPADTSGPADTPEHQGADERVAEGVDHLQVAAREMIAAARSFLDVAEEVVKDRAAVATMADLLGSVGEVVNRAVSRLDVGRADGDPDASSSDGDSPDAAGADGRPGSRVQHIDLT